MSEKNGEIIIMDIQFITTAVYKHKNNNMTLGLQIELNVENN
jgi:hypothetical protein